ncbi:MAG: hypothetical protein ACFFFG_13440 [Candidatus Thorarchaeota archaeon]
MDNDDLKESIKQSRPKRNPDHDTDQWLTLEHFPDDTRVNLTARGRKFIFQKGNVQKDLEGVVSRAQWSRYRSNPEMTIPLSTLRLLIGQSNHEMFMTSFTVTSIGSKKIQLPIRLPIRTKKNHLAKLLALLTLARNVFLTGTYQTDQRHKVEALIETFEEIFDVNLCPDGEIDYNQRGYYIKIPVQLCQALIKVFTGEYKANFPQIIHSVAKCEDEQDILDFVRMWLQFSRVYRFEQGEDLFMFRASDETREIVKLLEKLGVQCDTGSIMEGGNKFVPVYRIPNVADNELILANPSVVSRLRSKIANQNARIKELETIKFSLETELNETTSSASEKVLWSRGMDERLVEELTEKLKEFEHILIRSKRENEELKRLLRQSGTISSKQPFLKDVANASNLAEDLEKLRGEVEDLKIRLATIGEPKAKELSYEVTQKLTMKTNQSLPPQSGQDVPFGVDVNWKQLVKTFLAHPDNWILFLLSTPQALTRGAIAQILGVPTERRMELQRRLNDFVDKHILKVDMTAEGEEVYSIDRLNWSDQISAYRDIILGNKGAPLEIRQQIRSVLR